MTSDILMSLHPAFANAILDGKKEIEIRKRFNSSYSPGTRVFIYSTVPEKKIVGLCYIKKIETLKLDRLLKLSGPASTTPQKLKTYFNGQEMGFAIYVERPLRFDTPLSISDFNFKRPPQSYSFVRSGLPFFLRGKDVK